MSEQWAVVGDVGGTNVRFALAEKKSNGAHELHHSLRLAVRDFEGFDAALSTYIETLDTLPTRASFALAGPKFDDEIRMTNIDWIASEAEIKQGFGFNEVTIVNDFVAMARGVAAISAQDPHGLEPVLGGKLDFSKTVCVLGPGTGMGVAAVLPGEPVQILATEGGHTAFSPQNETEQKVRDIWQSRLGFVSAETLISGIGIFRFYTALCELENAAPIHGSQEEVVAAALQDKASVAGRTLMHFCEMLGTFAANTVVTQGASGGVVIAGGVGRHIMPFIAESGFNRRFLERGHGSWFVKNVAVHRLNARFVPLHGAAALSLT